VITSAPDHLYRPRQAVTKPAVTKPPVTKLGGRPPIGDGEPARAAASQIGR
jgi:hypothetical protein